MKNDNLNVFIQMSEKAVEIQKLWKPKHGDLIQQRHKTLNGRVSNNLDPLLVVEDIHKDAVLAYLPHSIYEKTKMEMVCWNVNNKWFNDSNGWWWWVWLPRQDQLQDIVMNHWFENAPIDEKQPSNFEKSIQKFHNEVNNYWEYFKLKSWEQLWLAFVMKECWNKFWNGKDWEKIA